MKTLFSKITLLLIGLIFTLHVKAQVFDYVNSGLSNPVGFTIDNGKMYIGSIGTAKIQTVDMSDPNLIPQDFVNNINFPTEFVVLGNELYFSYNLNKVGKIDLTSSTPVVTDVLSGFSSTSQLYGLAVKNNFIYVSFRNSGEIIRFDYTLGINPPIETVASNLGTFVGQIVIDGNYLYVPRGSDKKISRIDLSQTGFPVEDIVTISEDEFGPSGLGIKNNTLYYSSNYLKSVDLNNLSAPPVTYLSGLSPSFWHILFDSNEMYISQQTANRIVRFEDNFINPTTSPDYNVLVNFYNSNNGTNWENDTHWLDTTQSLYSWHGVVTENNRVISLNSINNNVSGALQSDFGNLDLLSNLRITGSGLTGLPSEITNLNNLENIQLSNNELSGVLPDFSSLPLLEILNIQNNNYLFGDLEPNFQSNINITNFFYSSQSNISDDVTQYVTIGQNITLDATTTGSNNQYQWFFNDQTLANETSPLITLNNIQQSQLGEYRCEITNSLVTDLTLETGKFYVIEQSPDFTLSPNGITCLCPNANFGDSGTLVINGEIKTFTKRTEQELRDLALANPQDPNIPLTCTSGITDMSSMFDGLFTDPILASFNQNLEHWDVSNVTDMTNMFLSASTFNQPLNSWDVSSVTSMFQMLGGASSFNQPLDNWDVGNVITMTRMFLGANSFNQNIDSWDVSSVSNMIAMFSGTAFNQPLNSWVVSNATNFGSMFVNSSFNQPLDNWDVSNVVDMSFMFSNSEYNHSLNSWNVSNVVNMAGMFNGAPFFNQSLNEWNVTSVVNMDGLFADSNFNQDISSWCVEQLASAPVDFSLNAPLQSGFLPNWGASCNIPNTEFVLGDDNTTCLCPDAEIGDLGTININGQLRTFTKRSENMLRGLVNADINNQQIALTCTSAVTDMSNLFKDKTDFNQTLEHWDVSNVANMSGMFENATSFNIPVDEDADLMSEFSSSNLLLSGWDVSNVTDMDFMFKNATVFNQDISMWCVEQIPSEPTEFSFNSALQDSFKPNWGATCTLGLTDQVDFSFTMYPNPTRDVLYIGNPSMNNIDKLIVYNTNGKVVMLKNVIDQQQIRIDLSELASGMYLIQINTQDDQNITRRIIKD